MGRPVRCCTPGDGRLEVVARRTASASAEPGAAGAAVVIDETVPAPGVRLVLLSRQAPRFDPAVIAEVIRRDLAYAPAPADNPLKGLVPYAGERGDAFPHSMEFEYLPLSALLTGPDRYDWQPLDALLDAVAGRGRQAVFRVFLEYPGRRGQGAIPPFLIADGLRTHRWRKTDNEPFPPDEVETPDYADPRLRRALTRFIAALGRKYDGDPRIGFITAGLLGLWGEWHDHPRHDLWASKEVQAEIMDAYEASFAKTPVLLRYPAGEGDGVYASNAGRKLGYHDDSFSWATLETGRREDAWFFLDRMRRAGPAALDRWKTRPIGGEIRPEAWGHVFDERPGVAGVQDFRTCVEAARVTWLMDCGMFRKETSTPERRRRAETLVRRMGYEFHVPSVAAAPAGGSLDVEMRIENRGVAPFYHDWPGEFGLLAEDGTVLRTAAAQGRLTGLLPGDPPRVWTGRIDLTGQRPARRVLAVRVPNPLPHGRPLRFANETQDRHAPGWLTLLTFAAEAPPVVAPRQPPPARSSAR